MEEKTFLKDKCEFRVCPLNKLNFAKLCQKNLSNSGVEVLEPADESAWAPGGGARLRRWQVKRD